MLAIHSPVYGPIDALTLHEVAAPRLGAHDVLVHVAAAGLHVGDVFGVHGTPYAMRLVTGLRRPRLGVPGFDLAGRVEAVGTAVTRFRVGDEVLGACAGGSCAELVAAPEAQLVARPAGMAVDAAAALATSGLAALHGLRAGGVTAGTRLLVVGAAGGVGHFAVQLGKAMGAEVTGVCGPANVDFVRGLGADHVIDYTREDFCAGERRYDVILDNVENRALADVRRVLTERGTLVCNSGTGATGLRMFVRLLAPLVLSPFSRQKLCRYLSQPNAKDLQTLLDRKVRPAVDRTYPLARTTEALAHIASGHARGKVVVTVA